MNESKQIRAYIGWFTTTKKIVALVLLLACVGSFVMMANGKKDPDPVKMDNMNGVDGSYVFVDVIAVSDWVYQYGNNATYYWLVDAEKNSFVALISDEDYKKLSAQHEYFEEDVPQPEPVRLTGLCKSMNATVREGFIEVCELSEDEFDSVFGQHAVTIGSSPAKNAAALWTTLAFITLIVFVIILLIALIRGKQEKKALARLEQRGLLNQAAADLTSPTVRSEREDRFRMSSRFLFGKGIGLAASWDDVLWAYQSVTRYNFIVTYRNLVICTADGVRHEHYYLQKKQDEIVGVMEYIREQNPNAMLGYSLDNNRAYREAVKRNK